MGRRAKYATTEKYQPYFDIIRKDLNIPDDFRCHLEFKRMVGETAGYASYRPNSFYGSSVVLTNHFSHKWTIEAIMHELKHIQQFISGRLKHTTYVAMNKDGSVRKNAKPIAGYLWDNKMYRPDQASKNPEIRDRYLNQPWEIEARAYEKEIKRLFPNNQLPIYARILVATTSDGVRWYKG